MPLHFLIVRRVEGPEVVSSASLDKSTSDKSVTMGEPILGETLTSWGLQYSVHGTIIPPLSRRTR